jgi:hypothetical protein
MASLGHYDEEMVRCPRVGGYVNFKFCRTENNLLPCRWVVGCWQMRLDITKFMQTHFSEEDLNRVFVPPKPKMESLIELIEKVKEGKKKNG